MSCILGALVGVLCGSVLVHLATTCRRKIIFVMLVGHSTILSYEYILCGTNKSPKVPDTKLLKDRRLRKAHTHSKKSGNP